MKSRSFEDVLREHILKKPETEETNTLPQNDANVFDVLRSLVTAGAANDAARSVLRGEKDDDTKNAACAAK